MKPIASVSLDLDNQWSYMKTHGDAGWEKYPTYLDVFMPIIIDLLDEIDARITFFVVGKDAADPKNGEALSHISRCGHETGNHSYHHEPWLHRYSASEIELEIFDTHDRIIEATGLEPVGFRGPGFSWSAEVHKTLIRRGYRFDASSLPSFIGPLARLYYFWTSSFSEAEKQKRRLLFGKVSDGFEPIRPHVLDYGTGQPLIEIPVTTIPIVRTPFHLSYLVYLSQYSRKLMLAYLELAVDLCLLTNVSPSFLLHPLDLLGGDVVPNLAFFPGMNVSTLEKREIFLTTMRRLRRSFRLVPMSVHASHELSQIQANTDS